MSNKGRTTLYIGVTSNLEARVLEHKSGQGSKFTSKYKCFDLIFYEYHHKISHAIEREKQLKNWHREWKLNLIKEENPKLIDLSESIGIDPETSSG
jgi:putative endonuclease